MGWWGSNAYLVIPLLLEEGVGSRKPAARAGRRSMRALRSMVVGVCGCGCGSKWVGGGAKGGGMGNM